MNDDKKVILENTKLLFDKHPLLNPTMVNYSVTSHLLSPNSAIFCRKLVEGLFLES